MKLGLFLCCMSFVFFDYQNVDVTIDVPKKIKSDEVIMLSGTISNNSEKKISFKEIELLQSLYRGDYTWKIIILKDGKRFFISEAFFHGPPKKVIKVKKNKKYSFEIPISIQDSSEDGYFPLGCIESGYYDIQLALRLNSPKNTVVKSNVVKFYLENQEE